MQDTDEARGRLIRAFAGNDMEKLFYFCLKKTGSYPEAEDLTQDIAMQIIAALSKLFGMGMADCAEPVFGMGKRKTPPPRDGSRCRHRRL